MKTIINTTIAVLLFITSFSIPQSFAQGNDSKIASTARSLIGKKDKITTKLNSLKSNYAVIYCAKQAGIITQKQSDNAKRKDLLSELDTKTSSVTRIPKGHIIGFIYNGKVYHTMISTGNGKAVGTYNKRGIGLGLDRVWEEISLQPLVFDARKGTFKIKGKQMIIVHRSSDKFILQPNPDKNGNTVLEDGNDPIKNPDPTQTNPMTNEKNKLHEDLKKYPWSRMSGTQPDTEYKKHKQDFPELGNWQQYAAKTNDIIRTMKSSNGTYKFSNPNLMVELYNDVYIYDKKERTVLRLDSDRKPVTMFRASNIGEFKNYASAEMNWYSKSNNNPSAQIKKEYKKYGNKFNFRHWSEYGYYAQNKLKAAVEKSKTNQTEFLLGRHNGHLVYYHKREQVFIIGNRNNKVITMFKFKDGEDEFNATVEEKYTLVRDPDLLDEAIQEYADVGSPLITGDEEPIYSNPQIANNNSEYDNTDTPLDGGTSQESEYDVVDVNEYQQNEYESTDTPLLDDYDPSTNYSGDNKYSTRDWAKVGNLPSARACIAEYKKCKSHFKTGITIKEYIAVAYNFIENTPGQTKRKSIGNGGTALYNAKYNLLATYDASGKPMSLQKPSNRENAYQALGDNVPRNVSNSPRDNSQSSSSNGSKSNKNAVFFNHEKVKKSESKVAEKYKKMKAVHPRLDNNDFLVIYHYSDANYQYINGALWKNESLDNYLKSFKNLLTEALDKLPNRRGTSYRGTRIPQSIVAKYENALSNNEIVTEAAFLSTSLDEGIAEQYSRIGGKQEDVSVLFIIKGIKGKDIDAISKYGTTFNGTEGEILFKSGSQFKVTRIEGDQGLMEIWLQEI